MNVDFEYNRQWAPQNLLNVKEIGLCAIEAQNDDGMYYYLIVATSLGISTIASCGPVIPDVYELPDGYGCSMYQMDYREDKLIKAMSMWLNNKDRKITQAKEVSISEALEQFRSLGDYLAGEIEIPSTEEENEE